MNQEIVPEVGQLWLSSETAHRDNRNRYGVVSDIQPDGRVVLTTWYDELNGLQWARKSTVRPESFRPRADGTWSLKSGWRPAKRMPNYDISALGDKTHLIGGGGS